MEKENDIQQPPQPAEAAASRYSDYTVLTSRGIHRFVKCRKGDRWVVLKGLKPEYREKPQCVALLKKEYKTAHALDHAGLVKYQALVDDDRYGPCIELECVDGRSLADYLREAHTTEEKLAVVQELADVLSYVHGRGVVHLGLKPSNIYITKQGNHVKLSDFRIVSADSLKEPVGVLKYMAPEVKDGTMTVDARADIYSLGMLLRDFALPADYAPVADKCCSFGRNERYMDAASVMEALYSDRSHGGSKKTVGIVAAIAVVIGLLVFVFFTGRGSHSDSANPASVTSVADSAQSPSESPAGPSTASAEAPARTENAAPVAVADKFGFLEQLKPALYRDLDKLFQPCLDRKAEGADEAEMQQAKARLQGRIKRYYKGLVGTLGRLDSEQRAAFDKTFADYVARKKAEL